MGFFSELFVTFIANILPSISDTDTLLTTFQMDQHFVVAGSPSGHAMGSSCVWYVMVTAALSHTVGRMDKSLTIYLHRSALLQFLYHWNVNTECLFKIYFGIFVVVEMCLFYSIIAKIAK